MSLSLKADASGTFGTLQVGGVDKVGVGATGLFNCLPVTSYANDAAAAVGGVPVGGLYHTTGTIKVRLV